MKIDVIVARDPDFANEIRVFIDGKEFEGVNVIDLDPGRGWSSDAWDAMRDSDAGSVHPVLESLVREMYDGMRDSPYID
jgi:hypothetical protein